MRPIARMKEVRSAPLLMIASIIALFFFSERLIALSGLLFCSAALIHLGANSASEREIKNLRVLSLIYGLVLCVVTYGKELV